MLCKFQLVKTKYFKKTPQILPWSQLYPLKEKSMRPEASKNGSTSNLVSSQAPLCQLPELLSKTELSLEWGGGIFSVSESSVLHNEEKNHLDQKSVAAVSLN